MDLSQMQDRWGELLMLVGAIGVAAEGTIAALLVLVGALRGLAGFLAAIAMQTGTGTDDRIIARVIRGLDMLAGWLDRAQRWIPRLRTGGDRRAIDPRGTEALGVLLVLGVGLSGCGASAIDVTRSTLAGGAIAVVTADPLLADAYEDAQAAFERGDLDEDAVAARLRKLDRAERALRAMSSALTAVDLALDAYEAGEECGLAPAMEGAASAAREVVEALDAAGLDVPPLVMQTLDLAGVFLDAPECEGNLAAVGS